MPGWEGKLSAQQMRGLVVYVRTFAPTRNSKATKASTRFEEKYQRLQKQYGNMHKEFEKRSDKASAAAHDSPGKGEPATAPESAPTARALFVRHCRKCHGEQGTGEPARARWPTIPDFTDAAWQAQRNDRQLLARILDGKGKGMPAWRDKLSEESARGLVAHVRSFSQQAAKDPPPAAEPEAASSSRNFLEKSLTWTGKFHPPVVSFPIALLSAAALAELFLFCTGRPFFAAAERFCLWIGAWSAVVAAGLGWCHAGVHLSDSSWIMTTHRWLGTGTACSAVLVLLVSEWSQRRWARRVVLFAVVGLVLATGFFGGALVFGLDHYAWPP
jgi:uncharacterized membrane protein/mono/diheme cytochrome c family protein